MAITTRTRLISALAVTAAAAVSTAFVVAGAPDASAAAITPPPANAKFDYQIGGAYPPPSGVQVVSRDREAAPAAGLYNICYVNAFQTQPGEAEWWQQNHDDLLLKKSGEYVVDGEWDEILLDVSTAAKRTAVAGIVGGWIDGCAADGFNAIEPDNQDSYDRSEGLLTKQNALDLITLIAARAHAKSLAIGQKNTTEFGTAGKKAGLDFAVAEQCGEWSECEDYTDVYGGNVVAIEYEDSAYTTACNTVGSTISVVRRDVKVTAPGSGTYVYKQC
ncbi:endo alpha-1,4 polygalactosaminidase [Catenuloplanes japonicus]|uniref:endo alpha-1,4 polygalactosaminidase n=1 Tax=Catenuloplanes japonicus TaxID=33876 RepID=UPI000526B241|nr:endo alpha-1,4 polygalactosaminidase [Catenuloplanes japonicus]